MGFVGLIELQTITMVTAAVFWALLHFVTSICTVAHFLDHSPEAQGL